MNSRWFLDIDPKEARDALFLNPPQTEGRSPVTQGFNTAIPEEIRQAMKEIEPGGTLVWQIREGLLVVLPIPADPVLGLVGRLKSGGTEALLEERRRDLEIEQRRERERGIPPAEPD